MPLPNGVLGRHRALAARLLPMFAVAAFMGCSDSGVAPLSPTGGTAAPAPALAQASMDELARGVAIAMGDAGVRMAVRDAMRASPWSEHKVTFQQFVRSTAGRPLRTALVNALGREAREVDALLAGTGPLDFYVPSRKHRLEWQGTADVVVVGMASFDRTELDAFTPAGDRVALRQGTPLPDAAIFFLHPAETRGARMFSQPRGRAGRTIQDSDDRDVGESYVRYGARGDSTIVHRIARARAARGARTVALLTTCPVDENGEPVKCEIVEDPAEEPTLDPAEDPNDCPDGCELEEPEPAPEPTSCPEGLSCLKDAPNPMTPPPPPSPDTTYITAWKVVFCDDPTCLAGNELEFRGEYIDTQGKSRKQKFRITGVDNNDWYNRRVKVIDRIPSAIGPVTDPNLRPRLTVQLVETDVVFDDVYVTAIFNLGQTRYYYRPYPDCPVESFECPIEAEAHFAFVRTTNPPRVTRVALTVPTKSLTVGGATTTYSATAYDQNGRAMPWVSFTWRSSNPAVASATPVTYKDAVITALAGGSSLITASAAGYSATVQVNVTGPPPPVASVRVTGDAVYVGRVTEFYAIAYDAYGGQIGIRPATWSSSNPGVATVQAQSWNSAGAVTGVAAGSTTIAATVDGVTGTRAVAVEAMPLTVGAISVQQPAPAFAECGHYVEVNGGKLPYSYRWTVNGEDIPADESGGMLFTNTGADYKVAVTVTDAAGAQGSASMTVAVAVSRMGVCLQ